MNRMKTTLNLDDRLLKEAKSAAARQHTSLTKLIEQGIQLRLRPPPAALHKQSKKALPVFSGHGGLRRGVDPTSNRSLYDAAD